MKGKNLIVVAIGFFVVAAILLAAAATAYVLLGQKPEADTPQSTEMIPDQTTETDVTQTQEATLEESSEETPEQIITQSPEEIPEQMPDESIEGDSAPSAEDGIEEIQQDALEPLPEEPYKEPTPDELAANIQLPASEILSESGPADSTEGPFYLHSFLNKSDGMCLVSLQLPKGADPIEVNNLSIDIECDGQTYDKVWSLQPADWCNGDEDTLLERDEIIATTINTDAKSIPREMPLRIKMMKDGTKLQEVTVLPS